MGYKMEYKKGHQIFEAGNVVLQSGLTLRGAKLAYQTYGTLNADRLNVILLMTPFGAQHMDIEWQVGFGRTLDPERYFIVIPNQFGNGMSSSPSNAVAPTTVAHWPRFTVADNVRIQRRPMKETFGIDRLKLACDWLMLGMQTNHWAERFPQRVEHSAVDFHPKLTPFFHLKLTPPTAV